eukprot:scaffold4785_cov137-Skeletonema_dohrnii-CCMP3373.AAC.2
MAINEEAACNVQRTKSDTLVFREHGCSVALKYSQSRSTSPYIASMVEARPTIVQKIEIETLFD